MSQCSLLLSARLNPASKTSGSRSPSSWVWYNFLRNDRMYKITPYTLHKAREINVTVKPSHNPKHKIDVYREGKLIASVGDPAYGDYPSYLDSKGKAYADERRALYHQRHKRDTMREFLAKWLLW